MFADGVVRALLIVGEKDDVAQLVPVQAIYGVRQ